MNMVRLLRSLGVAGLVAATTLPAVAQESSPSLDPGSAVCGLINFSFCPQGVPLPPQLAGPDLAPTPVVAPAPAPAPVHHKRAHKHVPQPKSDEPKS
jgi:hypothetical protein